MYSFENLPAMPLTIEGASTAASDAARAMGRLARARRIRNAPKSSAPPPRPSPPWRAEGSGVFSMLGHKGDIMLVHFRKDFTALNHVELALAKLKLWDYLEQTSSYLSVVELGLYESSEKTVHVAGRKRDRAVHLRME